MRVELAVAGDDATPPAHGRTSIGRNSVGCRDTPLRLEAVVCATAHMLTSFPFWRHTIGGVR